MQTKNPTLVIVLLALPCLATAQSTVSRPDDGWKTDAAFRRQLQTSVGVVQSGVPLRESLGGLARTYQVAILLDRRVDPGQPVDLSVASAPLGSLLAHLAEQLALGISFCDSVVYVGPVDYAAKLRTVGQLQRERIRRMPADVQRKWLARGPMSWPDFATPRQLLKDLTAENDLRLIGLEKVPHDLWAAADLPSTPLIDRLGWIAGQFDLAVRTSEDGSTAALVPLPERVVLVRDYPGGTDPRATVERWRKVVPRSEFRVVENRVHVRGPLEDHERIAAGPSRATKPPRQPAGDLANQRFTVPKAQAPLEAVLVQFSANCGLRLEPDPKALAAAGVPMDRIISLELTDVTIDELFTAVLSQAGCTFTIEGNVLRIKPPGS